MDQPAKQPSNLPYYDVRAEIFKGLVARGATPQQAMGVIYSLNGESTGLNTSAIGDGGRSVGFGQWNDKRRANLEATASSMGTTWNDPRAQVAHFFNEVDGSEKAAFDAVKGATTSADATRLWTGGYERPANNNWQQRYGNGVKMGYIDEKTGAPVWNSAPASVVAAQGGTAAPSPTPAVPATSGAQDFADAVKSGNVGGALGALTKGQDDKNKPKGIADQVTAPAPAASTPAPMLPSPFADNQGAQAQAGQQLLGQVMEQSAKPLSWSSRPYGAGMAGPQVPGTTLNSVG